MLGLSFFDLDLVMRSLDDGIFRKKYTDGRIVDYFKEDNKLIIFYNATGYSKENLTIETDTDDSTIKISGKPKNGLEKMVGELETTIRIKESYNLDEVGASINDGLLKIVIPTKKNVRIRKIEIK